MEATVKKPELIDALEENKKDVRKNNRKMHTILKQFIKKRIKLQAWQI